MNKIKSSWKVFPKEIKKAIVSIGMRKIKKINNQKTQISMTDLMNLLKKRKTIIFNKVMMIHYLMILLIFKKKITFNNNDG